MGLSKDIAEDTARDVWDAEEAKQKWIESRGVVESKVRNWHCLIRKGQNDAWPGSLPGDDHVSIWRRKDKSYIYVSQPYPLSSWTITRMTNAAADYGLEFSISTWPAWHFPGSVLFVEWTKSKDV